MFYFPLVLMNGLKKLTLLISIIVVYIIFLKDLFSRLFCVLRSSGLLFHMHKIYEPWYEISNNLFCATSKVSDQPAHMRRLIRALAGRLNIL